jgi:hypothetical protein
VPRRIATIALWVSLFALQMALSQTRVTAQNSLTEEELLAIENIELLMNLDMLQDFQFIENIDLLFIDVDSEETESLESEGSNND